MAKDTLWKDMDLLPHGQLVIVWNAFYGCKLRQHIEGDWYDDDENLDDSETEWDLWTELPTLPGPKAD